MSSVVLIRVLLGFISFCIIILLLKLNKSFKLDKRVSRYCLKIDNTNDDISYFDKLEEKYYNLVKKGKSSKRLLKYSKAYEKYTNDGINAIELIINKLLIAVVFVVLVIISYAIRGKVIGLFSFIITFVIGYYLYDIYLKINKKRNHKKIKDEMLRAVIIMNNAFKVGKSTLQAVDIARRDLPYPISREFDKIYQDMSYGLSVDVAFSRFAKRVNLEEANYIASVLTILNKTGGNIINVFNSIEKTLFDKKKLEEDLKNSTAASNLVVKFLMIVPILFIVILYVVSPTYFNPLFNSPLGYMVIFIIIIMFSIYSYLLNKIMKVKV